MAAEIKKSKTEELSFIDIVRREGDIKIPLIQRDYAQGRQSAEVTGIREKFLKDIHKAIRSKRPMNLDFVYGSADSRRFIPLDGQQRLTTLFLVHLYLDGLRGPQNEQLNFRFGYETRDSSRLFCQQIIKNRYSLFSVDSLEPRKDKDGNEFRPTPSSVIKNQSWWLLRWSADPTIAGMLRMLDAIDSRFFNEWNECAANLFSEEDGASIRFQFMTLKDFYDPDDLYIKMNARGLPLTEFEIFKGKWMEQIEAVYSPAEVKEMKKLIDVAWTDFLWPMRRLRKGLKNIDQYFQNLLKLVIGNSVASLASGKIDFDILFEANRQTLTFSYGKYVDDYGVVFDKTMLDRIKEELNEMCSPNSIFTKFRTGRMPNYGWSDLEKEWHSFVIQDGESGKPSYRGRELLYAMSRLSALIPSATPEEVNQWCRLIENLSENSRMDSSDEAAKGIKDIDGMLAELVTYYKMGGQIGSRVNDWLAQTSFKPEGFSNYQMEEEKIKAELRKDTQWNIQITEAERHPYLKGNIGLILWCGGEVEASTPFSSTALNRNLGSFKHYKERCMRLFDTAGNKDSVATKQALLVRAMLTKGNYMRDLGSDRRNIFNDPIHRDYSWKALFRINDSTGDKERKKAFDTIKEVLDDTDFDSNNVEGSLKKIIRKRQKKGMPLWRRILTSNFGDTILSYSHQGFIAFADGKRSNTLIYGSSRRNGYHTELNSLALELLLKNRFPQVSISAKWNIGTESDYGISINGYDIYYWDGQWSYQGRTVDTLSGLMEFVRDAINSGQR